MGLFILRLKIFSENLTLFSDILKLLPTFVFWVQEEQIDVTLTKLYFVWILSSFPIQKIESPRYCGEMKHLSNPIIPRFKNSVCIKAHIVMSKNLYRRLQFPNGVVSRSLRGFVGPNSSQLTSKRMFQTMSSRVILMR